MTYHIHITGQVQGVGFRPFVFNLALSYRLTGWVKNTIDGVHIRFNSTKKIANHFYLTLIKNAPRLSKITAHFLTEMPNEDFEVFEIVHSDAEGKPNVQLSPDFSMCPDCKNELDDEQNRRYAYPFITCTNCGPRYSIISGLPYDRPATTMNVFTMCPKCLEEYNNPLNRRYFSQTNSCPDCAVEMVLYEISEEIKINQIKTKNQLDIVIRIVGLLKEGKIIAVKGIGGYLLICDATNESTIQSLRKRKHRPAKAFALMYPNIELISKDMQVHQQAVDLLEGTASPIVLLKRKSSPQSGIHWKVIAPGLDKLGVMIPYTPLYALICQQFGKPVIATSGNISREPIIYENYKAHKNLIKIADFIVDNNRSIVVPQDDSVIGFSDSYKKAIVYRRSRGYAPGFIDEKMKMPETCVLAMGAMLKSSFTFLVNGIPFVSQYMGDLQNIETQEAFAHTLKHFIGILKTKPEIMLCDMHPQYYSTQLAESMSLDTEVKNYKIQHHEAHFAAILGEHHLFASKETIMGVIWDGTGFGKDGQIWGGEFFVYEGKIIERYHHLDYFSFILGDKMPREPRISALASCYKIEGYSELLKSKFSDLEWHIYETLLKESDGLQTSSMGRLFDAVACLTLGIDKTSYEGEAAMLLEVKARQYYNSHENFTMAHFKSGEENENCFSLNSILKTLMEDIMHDVAPGLIALKFHFTLVLMIDKMACEKEVNHIAFSGGVFQNALLVDLLIDNLADKYELYFHEKLSPNDECISFGQLMHFVHICNHQ